MGSQKPTNIWFFYYKKNSFEYNRLGISVSKKVGNSVVRHRVTRLIRESYRLNQEKLKIGYDIIVVARNTARNLDYRRMESAFLHLADLHDLRRAKDIEEGTNYNHSIL